MNTHISWIKKPILGAIFGLVLLGLSTFATDFNFALPASLGGGAFPISFGGGQNEFPGVLIISSQSLVNKTITFDNGGNSIICKRQIHGYYFNVARGIGLLPLSELSSETIPGVTVNGGLYTACGNGGPYLYDLIGAVKYTYNGSPQDGMGGIYFGVNIDKLNNTTDGSHQPGAIAWKVTNGINGMFFDSMFGVGTINTLPNDGGIGSVGNLIGVFSNIYIQGQASIGQSVEKDERQILSVNLAGTRTVLNNNEEANASKVINSASKNAVRNCPKYIGASEFESMKKTQSSTVCIDMGISNEITNNNAFVIDGDNYEKLINKDLVIKGGNVFLDSSIYNKNNNPGALSIFIPNGYLIFDSEISADDLAKIDKNGFRTTNQGVTDGVYLEGNFIVNGLILGSPDATLSNITTIPFKTYIHGKIATLNTMTSVSQQRTNHLFNLLGDRFPSYATLVDTENDYFSENIWTASLGDVFSWKCNDTTSMGAEPKGEFDQSTKEAVMSINCAVGHRYPLVITDKNIPSTLFNQ